MKSDDIKVMQEMSQEVVDLLPCGLMMDGNNNIYLEGKQESFVNVMMLIEKVKSKAGELNAIIQNIEGRKPSSK